MSDIAISSLLLVTAKENCPANATCIEYTVGGSDGNLFDSTWRHKGKRYICIVKECTSKSVVTDLLVVSDEDPIPSGYSAVSQTVDGGHRGLRKHLLCAKVEQLSSPGNAVTDIVLINRGKGENCPPNFYTITQEINELQISFSVKMINLARPPVPAPRPRVNVKAASDNNKNTISEIIPYSPSVVLAGIPIQLNPKFDSDRSMRDPLMDDLRYQNMDQLNREFNYDFSLENETINK